MLTMCTPGFTDASALASTRCRVFAVAGAATTRWSAAGSSRERSTTSTPASGLGACERRVATTRISNASARDAMAVPMPPRPISPSVRPCS